jgi:NAD(P)-dependent dehydrogenase (short-subunit alcohol dehydrogenase family)
MDLTQAKAVITGGASGLGFATAERIITAGGQVVLMDINEEQGDVRATELGDRAMFVRTDVSDEANVKASIQSASEFMGGITLAVNCAGIATAGRTLGREGTWPSDNFNRVIQINLVGSYNVTKEAAAVMQLNDPNADGERGVVISTASVAAFEGQIGQAAYSASKGGIVGMMLPLAREFAQFGIRVNTIAPGIFLTPMMAGMPEEVQESLGRQIPFPPRLGRPEEYADTTVGARPAREARSRLTGAQRQPKGCKKSHSRECSYKVNVARWAALLHVRVVRSATAFRDCPDDILFRVFDVAGFAVHAVCRADLEYLFATFLHDLIHPGRAISLRWFVILRQIE